jgi:hypothetical protein
MIAPGAFAKRPAIIDRVMERRDAAFLRGLVDTCREWPEIRKWLCEDFVTLEKVRENFKSLVDRPTAAVRTSTYSLADLSGESYVWLKEKGRVKSATSPCGAAIFGGRTWQEMEQLILRYAGGLTEIGVVLLVQHWRKTGKKSRFAPELVQAGAELLDAIILFGETRLLANLVRTIQQPSCRIGNNLRARIGYSDWWKLQAVLYIMRNPRPSYRTREVRTFLATMGIAISSLDFRRFCKRHCIRRDMRAGRPRGTENARW